MRYPATPKTPFTGSIPRLQPACYDVKNISEDYQCQIAKRKETKLLISETIGFSIANWFVYLFFIVFVFFYF